MPGDSIGHYRHIFNYALLYDGWAEALKVREALETSLTAMQLRIRREQDKIGRLLDLYAAGDLDRETYLAKCKTIEDGINSISVQAQDLEKRLAENPVILT